MIEYDSNGVIIWLIVSIEKETGEILQYLDLYYSKEEAEKNLEYWKEDCEGYNPVLVKSTATFEINQEVLK